MLVSSAVHVFGGGLGVGGIGKSESTHVVPARQTFRNMVHLCSRLLDRRSETRYIYVVGYIVLEDEMGDSKIDKEGT